MHDISIVVAEDLYLNVLRIFKIFFDKYIVYTKRFLSFAPSCTELLRHFFLCPYDSHTASAAAGRRF